MGIRREVNGNTLWGIYHMVEQITYTKDYSWKYILEMNRLNHELEKRWFEESLSEVGRHIDVKVRKIIWDILDDLEESDVEGAFPEQIKFIKQGLEKLEKETN